MASRRAIQATWVCGSAAHRYRAGGAA